MSHKEENLETMLDGICGKCDTPQDIRFDERWELGTLYMVGCCPGCSYEHSIPVKKI
jgi:hypothetical protein